MDGKGVLHMVYALSRNAYYVRSRDNGATFTAPVKVNSEGSVQFTMGERGPKLALGAEGIVHVVWVDCWAPGVRTFARYSRSTDGGKSFEPLKTISSMSGVDGVTLGASAWGDVLACWHTAQPPQKEVPQATWLHMTRSADSGVTFAPDERLSLTNHNGLACSMCMMRARFDADGNACLAFRSAENSVRDFYVAKAARGENRFTAVRVNQDQWELPTCPMCGPELTIGPDGQLLCAFMSRHKVYWSVAERKSAEFKLHVATPANEPDEIYPTAVVNRRGEVLFVWQVGPMSTTGRATVHWARYGANAKLQSQGIVGTTTSGTKATAFVGTDDQFYLVTTAE